MIITSHVKSRQRGTQKTPRLKAAATKLGVDFGANWTGSSDAVAKLARIELQKEQAIAAGHDLRRFATALREEALADDISLAEREAFFTYVTAARTLSYRYLRCTATLTTNYDPESQELVIAHSKQCRHRLCPNCAPMRARKQLTELTETVAEFQDAKRPYRLALLTLTTPLSDFADLHDNIRTLARNTRKLLKTPPFMAVVRGAYFVIEVTFKADLRKFHDHVHVLMALDPDYSITRQDLWISQGEIVRRWAAVNRTDQRLVVDIRLLKGQGADAEPGELRKSLAELTTYLCAPLSLMSRIETYPGWSCDAEALLVLAHATHRRRLIGATGVFAIARRMVRKRREQARREA